MHWIVLAAGTVGTVIGAFLWNEGIAGRTLLGLALAFLLAAVVLARRRTSGGAMGSAERALWVLVTGAAVGWAVGLALGTVPSLLAGETYEIIDPAVYLSGLGLVIGLCAGAAVALGLATGARR